MCDSKTFVANQNYDPIGSVGYNISPNSQLVFSKKAHVYKSGRARISFVYNIITSSPTGAQFNVYRQKYHCNSNYQCDNDIVSLTNGPQILYSGSPSSSEINTSFNTIDTTVEPGEYTYSVVLINNDNSATVNIDFGSFVISTGKNLHYYTSSNAQQYPSITDPAIVILVPSPNVPNTTSFQFDAEVFRDGEISLNYSGNMVINIPPGLSSTNLTFDLQRDGTSIVNGPQNLLTVSNAVSIITYVINLVTSINFVDATAPKGRHTYTLILTNNGHTNVELDFLSFSGTSSRSEFKNYVNQEYPPISAPSAILLPPLSRADVNVNAKVHEECQAMVTFTLNTVLAPLSTINLSSLLFEVTRTNKKETISLTNGLQNLINSPPSVVLHVNTSASFSPSFYFVDSDAPQGENKYTLSLVNNSSVNSSNIDYYTFTVTS